LRDWQNAPKIDLMSAPDPIASLPPRRWPRWLRVLAIGRNWKFTLARLAVLIATFFIVFCFF